LEVFDDLGGDDVGIRKVGAVLKRFVFEPEDVEVEFVALEQLLIGETFEALGLFFLSSVLGTPPASLSFATPRRFKYRQTNARYQTNDECRSHILYDQIFFDLLPR